MSPISLHQLLQRARRAVALNFPSAAWITAELSQVTERRGNYYIQLVEKGTEQPAVIAKANGVLWQRSFKQVIKQRGSIAEKVLEAGREVSLLVEVDFHEVYGFKLNVIDWDPEYTLGQLALKRQEILAKLEAHNYLSKNRQLKLPGVVQRVALLTSSAAAGYADFKQHLEDNPYGYKIMLDLYDVAVQGARLEASVLSALQEVNAKSKKYDVVAILRGGGSKLDLADFDSYEIGKAIAESNVPVIVGIGHEIDNTIPDHVAHTSLKTPTALAEFIINHTVLFESDILRIGRELARVALRHTTGIEHLLNNQLSTVKHFQQNTFRIERESLQKYQELYARSIRQSLYYNEMQINAFENMLLALDPKAVLKRGFALVRAKELTITNSTMVQAGDVVKIQLTDTTLEAEIL